MRDPRHFCNVRAQPRRQKRGKTPERAAGKAARRGESAAPVRAASE